MWDYFSDRSETESVKPNKHCMLLHPGVSALPGSVFFFGCSKRLWRKMADGCHGGGTLWAWRAWRRVTVVLLCVCHTTLAILPKVEEFLQSFSLLTSLEQFLFHNNDHTGNRAALLLLCSNHISFTSGSRTLQCFLTVSWGVFAAGAALLEKHSG